MIFQLDVELLNDLFHVDDDNAVPFTNSQFQIRVKVNNSSGLIHKMSRLREAAASRRYC